MKEFYIAPEVQILCFAPVEKLASSDWANYSLTSNNGDPDLPGEDGSTFDTTLPPDSADGE